MNTNYDVLIAVDIGLSGGIAFFDLKVAMDVEAGDSGILYLRPMPTKKEEKSGKVRQVVDYERLKFMVEIPAVHNDSALLVYENVHTFPGQGAVSSGQLMEQKGVLKGLAMGLGYGILEVDPRTWQRGVGLVPPKELKGESAKKTRILRKKWLKQESVARARTRFPDWLEHIDKYKDGMSDALWIGTWAINQLGVIQNK